MNAVGGSSWSHFTSYKNKSRCNIVYDIIATGKAPKVFCKSNGTAAAALWKGKTNNLYYIHTVCYALLSFSVVSDSATPWTVARQTPLSMEILQERILEWVVTPGDLPNSGIELRSPALQVDSLPSEPPGMPMNTGVSSLSLLQGIFLTQELNWGCQHWRWILYQLSYQGSPSNIIYIMTYICCCCSVTKFWLSLCDPMVCSTLG